MYKVLYKEVEVNNFYTIFLILQIIKNKYVIILEIFKIFR